jgi:hypothetical protein
MPKLSDLLAEKAKTEIQIGGATVAVVFFVLWRERFSDEEWTQLLAATGREYLKMLLPRILVSWDIVDDEGHAIPPSAEAIEQHHIPDALLFAIERRVLNTDLSGKVISSNSHVT